MDAAFTARIALVAEGKEASRSEVVRDAVRWTSTAQVLPAVSSLCCFFDPDALHPRLHLGPHTGFTKSARPIVA